MFKQAPSLLVYLIVIYVTQKIYVKPPYPLYQEVELSIVKCENPKLHNFCTGTPKGAGCVSGMEGRQCNNALKIALYCFKLLPKQIIIQKTCLPKNLVLPLSTISFLHSWLVLLSMSIHALPWASLWEHKLMFLPSMGGLSRVCVLASLLRSSRINWCSLKSCLVSTPLHCCNPLWFLVVFQGVLPLS